MANLTASFFMLLTLPTLAEPVHFSLAEKIVFIALALTSGYLFWRRFGVVVRKILASKKDPNFHLFPISKRVWDFFWEVLCQAKVIRERPLPGFAHALVFWAFLAFALVTLNHCAVGLGIGFLSPDGVLGRFYFYFAALFALACAVGIAGLFVRRFLVRPRWLGAKVSWESGFIAFLIFALMVDVPGVVRGERHLCRGAGAVVAAHAGAADVSSPHPAYEAFAPGAEPGDGVSIARHICGHSAARGR